MLALSRKLGESIIIGNDIEIKILDIKGDQIKIGISAPKTVPILRKELYVAVEEENQESIKSETNIDDLKKFFQS